MISREELWDILRSNGASVRDTMSRRVSCLLVGTGYGETKISHARKHGIPTISLPMAQYLDLLEQHGRLDTEIPADILAQVILNTAFLCEVLYAKSLDSGGIPRERNSEQQRALGRFYMLAVGLERLLQNTRRVYHGPCTGDALGDTFSVLPTVDSVRLEAAASDGSGV
jgi:hypothetical protein